MTQLNLNGTHCRLLLIRIVGGFDAPEPVPWFVILQINTLNGSLPGERCGASLITSRFEK